NGRALDCADNAGVMAWRKGRATAAPAPRRNVRRDRCFFVMIIDPMGLTPLSTYVRIRVPTRALFSSHFVAAEPRTSLPPLRGSSRARHEDHGLQPWLHSFAAPRLGYQGRKLRRN